MENASEVKTDTKPIPDVDFEKMRCGKCQGYLNCPPIMTFLERNEYAECGRCFNTELAEREGLHAVRNRSLEVLVSVVPFPCKNLSEGCLECRTYPQIEMHESICAFRTFMCPLFVLKSCTFRSGMQKLIEHFREEHPDLLLTNGLLNIAFDSDFENHYLVQQNSDLFVVQVKYDSKEGKAWFAFNLLEKSSSMDFNLEFTDPASENSLVMKHNAVCKPLTALDTNTALKIDLTAVRTLLKEPEEIKCKVFVNTRFSSLLSAELFKEIQCPVCWEFMRGKIFLCKNGHNVCSKCKEFVLNCPSCRDNILDIRNLSLEKLITRALYPCKNNQAGCNFVANIEEIIYHFDHCSFAVPE